MSDNNYDSFMAFLNIPPQEVVSIPVSLSEAQQGNYFVGQTETLHVSQCANAWAGLVNPKHSQVDLYTNVFTISNFSEDFITAEIWLNSDFPEEHCVSQEVSSTNTTFHPIPENKVEIQFVKSTKEVPEDGTRVYQRIVPPNTTMIGEEDGKFIASQGGSYVIILKSSSLKVANVVVAFGWWEK